MNINEKRLINKINELGQIGINSDGQRTRLALSDEDKLARDLVINWMKELDLQIKIDKIGNIFGFWNPSNSEENPIMTGSHIDTVINAGKYDGCLGVIAGLEVIKTMKENNIMPKKSIAVGVFTNEEGVRYQPDMMGSLIYAGGRDVDSTLKINGIDGTILGEELKRIGYFGESEPKFVIPDAFVELHIEQGPILDMEGVQLGAVENLQGISWQKVTITGEANHAGTTPMKFRKDAGYAAAKIIQNLHEYILNENDNSVINFGTIAFEPNAVNVVPSKATFTIDLRNPDKKTLNEKETYVKNYFSEVEKLANVSISSTQLVHFDPVEFDENIVHIIEKYAEKRNLTCKRMTSGAGQDAQMLAKICPTAMIFVPSVDGISHNPNEFTNEKDIIAGANVLFDVIYELSEV